jgi:phosphoribosylglycinamide formyltransferase 1
MTLRLAVLASGGGRTLQNFIDLSASGALDIEIALLGVSKARCGAVERAAMANIPCFSRRKKKSESAAEFSRDVFAPIRASKVDLVCLAGYLSLLEIPEDFERRVINIHPALIPAFSGRGFYGERVHEAVWKQGLRVTGCTVHYCDNIYDNGPIILQRPVLVNSLDSPETIAAKVFAAECEAYPTAVRWIIDGRIKVVAGRCMIDSASEGSVEQSSAPRADQ